jgi:hypothetical protein
VEGIQIRDQRLDHFAQGPVSFLLLLEWVATNNTVAGISFF